MRLPIRNTNIAVPGIPDGKFTSLRNAAVEIMSSSCCSLWLELPKKLMLKHAAFFNFGHFKKSFYLTLHSIILYA